jgi:hypothetical protein
MPRQLYIAVHGVGDQKQFDTVQATARQIIRVTSGQAGQLLSLGTFSSSAGAAAPPLPPHAFYFQPSDKGDLGFVEVYWADLCRDVQRAGYRLEEGVPWAQTLVDRVKALKASAARGNPDPDYELIRAVIGEMGSGLQLLGWLSSLAPKLQLPTFDVDDIVDQYLGDVQFVAEFGDVRDKILARFSATLDNMITSGTLVAGDDIYLITHSEGTVVTLLGLLTAMTGPTKPVWLDYIRGWMTIGSPIDKHLILWPDLWKAFLDGPKHWPSQPIVWWNYSDYGDPIGYELNSTRAWMRGCGPTGVPWTRAFQFEKQATPLTDGRYVEVPENIYETIFNRYPWPGKAHVDYWTDDGVFNHFHATVVQRRTVDRITDRPWTLATSYGVPYLMAFVVLGAGMFFLDKGIWNAQGLQHDSSPLTFFREVLATTWLLAGTTVLARMPRIVREKEDFLIIGVLIFAIFACGFFWVFPGETSEYVLQRLLPGVGVTQPIIAGPLSIDPATAFRLTGIVLSLIVGLNANFLRCKLWRFVLAGVAFLAFAGSIGVLAYCLINDFLLNPGSGASCLKHWSPIAAMGACFAATILWTVWQVYKEHSAGLWPLIGPGFTAVAGIGVAVALSMAPPAPGGTSAKPPDGGEPALWPLLIGAIAFLYLWRLAAILFDLTFVWHRYIRHNALLIWYRKNLGPPQSIPK